MRIFKHQLWHILFLLVLLFSLYLPIKEDSTFLQGDLWGISTLNWYILAILSPIVHQIYVLICWRSELYYKSISKKFGDNGFKLYKIGFVILILSRLILIILLAISSAKTINIHPIFSYVLSAILMVPVIYLFYSVLKYFDVDRAFGSDHFNTEEAKKQPFVNQGIFKYTSNGMYIFGLLILWLPGILLQSKAALFVAFFNHAYIWVHYYTTELPDMKFIYKEKIKEKSNSK